MRGCTRAARMILASMQLRLLRDHYASDVATRILGPSAELILDALPPLPPQLRLLEVQAGAGLLTRPLVERIAGLGVLVAVEEDPALWAHLPHAAGRALRVSGRPQRLPFVTGAFDVCVANIALGDAGGDPARLREVRRVTRAGGWLVATVLLRGSFDELFDVLSEACEAAGLSTQRQVLTEARAALFDETTFAPFEDAGFAPAHVGVEERGLFFQRGVAALSDPLVREVLVPAWLGGASLSDEAWARAAGALDAYFGSDRFAVRIRTAVVVARPR